MILWIRGLNVVFAATGTLFYFHLFAANENRYEGSWRDDKKNGPGKFFYLTTGQIYEGVWNNDIAKCGSMKDFNRDEAPKPTKYPIPDVSDKSERSHSVYIVMSS